MSEVSLDHVSKAYDRSGLVVDDVTLTIEEGEFFTLLGPSGCGKTTTLRMIAGFEEPTGGTIRFGERDVTPLPPNKRNVGIVFQNYALFPHMTVSRNVEFGLRAQHVPRSARGERVRSALHQVQLDQYLDARVDQLSGGQQQRVALARAIVIEPELLLLDEPLSNLDAKLREETRVTLRELHHQTGQTFVYVTHDQSEALAMSTRIAVMSRARVHQVGTPLEVYTHPASRFVAGFLGRNNILDGVVTSVDAESSTCVVALDSGVSLTARTGPRSPRVGILQRGSAVGVAVRAEDVRPAGEPDGRENVMAGQVRDVEYIGARIELTVDTPAGPLLYEAPVDRELVSRGDTVHLEVPVSATYLLEPPEEASEK